MKELYFSPDSIDIKAQRMLNGPGVSQRNRNSPLSPERSALLILDMQSYFLDESSHAFIPSGKTIIPRLKGLAAAYARKDLPVIFTRHVNSQKDAGRMADWWRQLIMEQNPLSEIVPELDTIQGVRFDKSQYDAFYRTRLEDHFLTNGVSQVVIGGVMTHLCCETTARAAFTRGFEVFFLVDGTATYNQVFHQASLVNLSHGFAALSLIGEIQSELAGAYGG